MSSGWPGDGGPWVIEGSVSEETLPTLTAASEQPDCDPELLAVEWATPVDCETAPVAGADRSASSSGSSQSGSSVASTSGDSSDNFQLEVPAEVTALTFPVVESLDKLIRAALAESSSTQAALDHVRAAPNGTALLAACNFSSVKAFFDHYLGPGNRRQKQEVRQHQHMTNDEDIDATARTRP